MSKCTTSPLTGMCLRSCSRHRPWVGSPGVHTWKETQFPLTGQQNFNAQSKTPQCLPDCPMTLSLNFKTVSLVKHNRGMAAISTAPCLTLAQPSPLDLVPPLTGRLHRAPAHRPGPTDNREPARAATVSPRDSENGRKTGMERRGLEKSQGKSGLRSPHCAAEASSHSHTVPWEAERLPFLPGKRKEGKLLWSGKGVDHGPAGWEGGW